MLYLSTLCVMLCCAACCLVHMVVYVALAASGSGRGVPYILRLTLTYSFISCHSSLSGPRATELRRAIFRHVLMSPPQIFRAYFVVNGVARAQTRAAIKKHLPIQDGRGTCVEPAVHHLIQTRVIPRCFRRDKASRATDRP